MTIFTKLETDAWLWTEMCLDADRFLALFGQMAMPPEKFCLRALRAFSCYLFHEPTNGIKIS